LEEVWLRSSRLRFCLNSICRGNIGSSFVSFTLELWHSTFISTHSLTPLQ
jgi:hypothetical protein